jgi:hypothetical protein
MVEASPMNHGAEYGTIETTSMVRPQIDTVGELDSAGPTPRAR